MLAVMESHQTAGTSTTTTATTPEPNPVHVEEFLTSGRTGRRNALPDILGEHAAVTSSDLPARLQSLTTSDKPGPTSQDQPGTSKSWTFLHAILEGKAFGVVVAMGTRRKVQS